MKNPRFMIGFVAVGLVVGYLAWTGISSSMVYYLTPTELLERADADPTFGELAVKVSGRLVPGSYRRGEGQLEHHFTVADLEHDNVRFAVEYNDVLPDTFHGEDVQVVVEGTYDTNGVFHAKTVLTKCGSRYEAAAQNPEAVAEAGA